MHLGSLIANRFRIERFRGAGGFGAVYRAQDTTSGLPVAVKVLRDVEGANVERFRREAEVLAEIDHPAVVRYVAHGPDWIVMEWLDGEDLGTRLGRGRLGIAQTVALAKRVADGLAVAHARGVVHRDVKPRNVFLPAADPARAKVLDFGLARRMESATVLTRTGMMVGSCAYMAPEQIAADRNVDGRADLFALGTLLFECATGRHPFAGMDREQVMLHILVHDPPTARSVAPDVPEPLSDLIARLHAKEPEARPDAAEIARVLGAMPADRAGLRVATEGKIIEWTGGAIDVGKHPSAGVVVEDKAASRFHAEIYLEGDRVMVRDLESKNGVLVDGKRVREAALSDGSVIEIGRTRLQVSRWIAPRLEAAARVAASSASVLIEGQEGESLARALAKDAVVVRANEPIPADGTAIVLGAEALTEVPPGARIIAVTKVDLRLEVNAGRFPAKLFHRLAGVRLRAPDVVLS